MKRIYVNYNERERVNILGFGIENDWVNARWGRGSRNQTIIHYVLSGEGYFNNIKVKRGEGFYIPNNKMHEYHSSEENPWSYFFVILNGAGADNFVEKLIKCDENGVFNCDFSDRISSFVAELMLNKGSLSQTKAMGYFLILMSYHEDISGKTKKANKYVEDVKNYIKFNLHHPIRIREMAEYLHISDRYLYNLFIEYEGISPKQYINDLRLKYAAEHLKENRMNITEIANSLGFSDPFAFSRFFSGNMGVSPREYKNNHHS